MFVNTGATAPLRPFSKAESYRIETMGECTRCGEAVNAIAFGVAVFHRDDRLRQTCRGSGEFVK